MKKSASSVAVTNWKHLYRAAIFEKNRTAISERISKAERAILARGRELLWDGSREERNALDNALHALRAYRAALGHTEAA